MTLLFWRVGNRINQEILGNQRAEYEKRIVPTVSAQLEKAYRRNFTEKNVRRMLRFAEYWTALASKKKLESSLPQALIEAKERIEKNRL